MIRTPIIAFLGHVNSGKTTLQDFIRKTAIVKSEAGEITQSIGASLVPDVIIKNLCGDLLNQLKIDLKIPGLLMIDTPGHAAFVSLRKRGGTLADLAVLVVDINEGLMPQTLEAIEILKRFKTPFLIAANKLDTLNGWKPGENLLQNIPKQEKSVQDKLDTLLYSLVTKLAELELNADRYDRVDDYTKALAIVPCSAKTGEGIPELLVMAAGLSQRFLGKKLEYSEDAPAKGTILEVKKERGLGMTLDTIIYDGVLSKEDELVIGGIDEPIVTKVKALFEPKKLLELSNSTKFQQVDQVVAATGVKIAALGIENVSAGMPLLAVKKNLEETKALVQKEIAEMAIELDITGVIAKADTLGSLEALVKLLKEHGIKVKKAAIGEITRKDVSDAVTNIQTDPLSAAVIGFNVNAPSITTIGVQIITGDVIYTLIDRLQEWQKKEKTKLESSAVKKITKPCKLMLLKGYIFRQSNPAIVGTEILMGTLQTGAELMKDGTVVTIVKEIQEEKENVTEARKGKQVAVAYEKIIIGRQLNEGDTLYSFITDKDYRKLKELKQYLTDDEKEALREIAAIMRKQNPLWGV